MGKINRTDIEQSFESINYGVVGQHILAGVNGNIPEGWRATGVYAFAVLDSMYNLVVCVSANGPLGAEVGAKVNTYHPIDHLKVADEAARQISEKIRTRQTVASLHPSPEVKIVLDPGAIMPTRGSAGASGYDLYAPTDVLIRPGQVVVIHSGVRIELPDETWEAQIRPRSGMSKRGLWVAVGTVDSDYRGVVGATVINTTKEDQRINAGDRFAQMVFGRIEHPRLTVTDALSETIRGSSGFGSSGR